jgi:ArsR family transcriptional regulator, virulence genes transcriptional regulator
MDINALHAKAGLAAVFLKQLASSPRLMILCELLQAERSVSELETVVGLSQSALSQHLARLRRAKLVRTRREAQTIHYSLADPGIGKVLAVLYDRYCRAPRRR